MVTKKPKGLGRGLEALLGPKVEDGVGQDGVATGSPGLPHTLFLSDMVPGQYQPRTRMDEGALYELAESIKAQGIMQPILVRRLADGDNQGKYEIIAGERRFRAARLAGLDSVPVLVRDVPNESAAAMAPVVCAPLGAMSWKKRLLETFTVQVPANGTPVRRPRKPGPSNAAMLSGALAR